MAYISTEEVKNIRTQLRKEFPNLKFSVTRHHSSKVSVIIKSGDLDFFGTLAKPAEYKSFAVWSNVQEQFTNKEVIETLQRIIDITYGQNYYDKSDIMVDYFNVAYYASIDIGMWNKPYELNEQRVA